MKTREDITLLIDEGRERHDFGVVDSKGRAFGSNVRFQVQTYVEVPEDAQSWRTIAPGTYYCWVGYATRAGEPFGASQSWRYCKTEAERIAEVAKYLKGAKARAVKQFGV